MAHFYHITRYVHILLTIIAGFQLHMIMLVGYILTRLFWTIIAMIIILHFIIGQ